MAFVETPNCLRMSFTPQPPQKDADFLGNPASHVLANVIAGPGGGRMWKPRLISALNHPYLLRLGDRPSQANRRIQRSGEARLGRKRAVEEPFPTALSRILLRSGSLGSGEEHHGNGAQVPPSHLLLQTSPRESTLQGSAADYRHTH